MNNKNLIVTKLVDSKKWPEIYRPEFLEELNTIADKLYYRKNLEGYISSLLIYHQITEAMIKVLINISTFFIQSHLLEFEYKDKDLNKKMYGQLVNELDACLKIEGTNEFIQKCKELNDIRIKVVHKITKSTNLIELKILCNKSKKIFDQIFKLFDFIYDNWRLCLKDAKKDYEGNL